MSHTPRYPSFNPTLKLPYRIYEFGYWRRKKVPHKILQFSSARTLSGNYTIYNDRYRCVDLYIFIIGQIMISAYSSRPPLSTPHNFYSMKALMKIPGRRQTSWLLLFLGHLLLPAAVIPSSGGYYLLLPAAVIPSSGGYYLLLPPVVIPSSGGYYLLLSLAVIPSSGGYYLLLPPAVIPSSGGYYLLLPPAVIPSSGG
jgi:hypothetical protein